MPPPQASRFPDNVYPGVKFLLGHSSSDVQSQLYETIYRTRLSDDPKSGKASYDLASSSSASSPGTDRLGFPEEVLALQFNHVKKLAKDAAGGEAVLDVVVTVSGNDAWLAQPFTVPCATSSRDVANC